MLLLYFAVVLSAYYTSCYDSDYDWAVPVYLVVNGG